jgi:hypothetical protein
MEIKNVKITELVLNDQNPRFIKDHKFKKLVESIKSFEKMLDIRPIVVDENMVILGGNMRFRACREAGLKKIPVMIVENLTDAEKNEFMIKDNVGFGEWNFDMLANTFDSVQLVDWGMDVPIAFNDDDLFDIENASGFNESVNFTIKCDSIEQMEQLQTKLNIGTTKIGFNEFLIKTGL